MTFAEAALLGFVQGVAEWLPVSSEGVVAAIQTLAFGADAADAVAFSLWLHLGTALAALAALRKDAAEIVRSAIRAPTRPTRAAAFLAVATLTSAPLGLALLAGVDGFSERIGGLAMALVGALMMVTGAILLRGRRGGGARTREDVGALDALLVGAAQGLAALPGLSRSGLTVSALLWRGVDRREALALSFLLSVPASVGAGLYAALDSGLRTSPPALLALAVSAAVGFIAVRALMGLARRINFGWFALAAGAAIAAGGTWTWAWG